MDTASRHGRFVAPVSHGAAAEEERRVVVIVVLSLLVLVVRRLLRLGQQLESELQTVANGFFLADEVGFGISLLCPFCFELFALGAGIAVALGVRDRLPASSRHAHVEFNKV